MSEKTKVLEIFMVNESWLRIYLKSHQKKFPSFHSILGQWPSILSFGLNQVCLVSVCVPNFSSLAGLEVTEKFVVVVVGWGGVEQLVTMFNLNPMIELL